MSLDTLTGMDTLTAVADRLTEQGITATVEYPGAVVILLRPDMQVWTGLCGWDYGTASRLDADNTWQPADDVTAEVDLHEDETDPDRIAAAWAAFVARAARPRVLIRKDPEPDPVHPWYYTVEHFPPRPDALDYGSVETWPAAMSAAAAVLDAERGE